MGAFDAAAYCASISAAKRRKSQCEGAGAVMHGADDKQQPGSPTSQQQRQLDTQQRQHSDQAGRPTERQAGALPAEPGSAPASTISAAAGAPDATVTTTIRGRPSQRPCAAQHSRLLASTRVFFKKLAFWDK
jgi:hypothetical protein